MRQLSGYVYLVFDYFWFTENSCALGHYNKFTVIINLTILSHTYRNVHIECCILYTEKSVNCLFYLTIIQAYFRLTFFHNSNLKHPLIWVLKSRKLLIIRENGGPWHMMPQAKTVTIKKRRSYANQKNLSA